MKKIKGKLNMEHVGSKQHKEENIMKRARKYLAILMAVIMVVSMVACDSDNGGNVSSGNENEPAVTVTNNNQQEPEVTEPETTEPEVTEPETTDPVEVVDPDPVVEDNPNVIKGVDFTDYNVNGGSIFNAFDKLTCDKLMWVIRADLEGTGNKKVIDALFDGDSFDMLLDKSYKIYLYIPERVDSLDSISIDDGDVGILNVGDTDIDGNSYSKVVYELYFNSEGQPMDNMPVSITVTYDDGSTESLTVYFTRN